MLTSLLLAMLTAAAQDPSCEPVAAGEITSHAEEARTALMEEDLARYQSEDAAIRSAVPCLAEILPPVVWADHMVTVAIAAFAANEDWQTPLWIAVQTDPTVDRAVGAQHPIAQWTPPPANPPAVYTVQSGQQVFLDGRPVSFLPDLRGPHLVQVRQDGSLTSMVLDDATPDAWKGLVETKAAAPPMLPTYGGGPARPRRQGAPALVTGGVLLAGGVGMVAYSGLKVVGQPETRFYLRGEANTLKVINTTGWVLAGAGLGVGYLGLRQFAKGPQVLAGPSSITIRGRF